MKRSLLCYFSLGLAVLSAEPVQDDSQTATILPDPASIRFTPPPPPKEVPTMSVKGSTTADFGTHRITILRGEESTLPDIPKPTPPIEQSREVALEPSEPHYVFFISGSTNGDSLSRITVWNPITRTQHEAWCGWDVSLIAPFQEITHEGKSHSLFMGVGRVDSLENPEAATSKRPEVKPGSILVPDGDEYTAAILTSMRDACFQNMPKLLELKIAREEEIELKYINKAFVHSFPHPSTGVATANRFTTAHELLHVLAPKLEGNDHDEVFTNILVTREQNIHVDHRSRKRINSEQQKRIYEHLNVEDL